MRMGLYIVKAAQCGMLFQRAIAQGFMWPDVTLAQCRRSAASGSGAQAAGVADEFEPAPWCATASHLGMCLLFLLLLVMLLELILFLTMICNLGNLRHICTTQDTSAQASHIYDHVTTSCRVSD